MHTKQHSLKPDTEVCLCRRISSSSNWGLLRKWAVQSSQEAGLGPLFNSLACPRHSDRKEGCPQGLPFPHLLLRHRGAIQKPNSMQCCHFQASNGQALLLRAFHTSKNGSQDASSTEIFLFWEASFKGITYRQSVHQILLHKAIGCRSRRVQSIIQRLPKTRL